MTQKELANKIGVSNTTISNWEKGVSSLDIEMLGEICKILEVDVNDMYIDESNEITQLVANAKPDDIIVLDKDSDETLRTLSDDEKQLVRDYIKLLKKSKKE